MITLMTLFSGNTCYLDINGAVTPEDAGMYKCVLADKVDMQTVPRTIETLVCVYSVFHQFLQNIPIRWEQSLW